MDGQENSHGVDTTPEITNADAGAGKVADPAQPGTEGGKTLPIGGADGAQPSLHKPEGIADHLIGQTDQETIDRLFKENKGFRDAQAKGPQVPEKADAYAFNWSDKLKAAGGVADDDPALAAFKDIAHEHGYTQSQIDAIPKFMDVLVDKGLIEKPFDTNGLLKSLAPEGYRGTDEQMQAKGGERLLTAENWIKQLTAQQGFTEGMKNDMRLLTTSADGVAVIEALMKSGSNPSIQPGGGIQQQGISKSDLEARTADPRNDAFGAKFDPAYAEETRKLFKQMYPDD